MTTTTSAYTAQSIDVLLDTLRAYLHTAVAYLPRLAFAALLILFGWLLACVARYVIAQALRAINFHVVTERAGTDRFLEQAGIRGGTPRLFALLGYWVVLLATLSLACNDLGLRYLAELLGHALLFLPRLLGALLTVVFGSYCARYVGNSIQQYCEQTRLPDGDLLGRIARYLIMVFVVMIALNLVEADSDILQRTFLVLLAGVVLTLALAFGIGGKDWAAELLERWWPRRKRNENR